MLYQKFSHACVIKKNPTHTNNGDTGTPSVPICLGNADLCLLLDRLSASHFQNYSAVF